jgi:hypothetical protein
MVVAESSFGSHKYHSTRVLPHFDLSDRLSARKDSSVMIQMPDDRLLNNRNGVWSFWLRIFSKNWTGIAIGNPSEWSSPRVGWYLNGSNDDFWSSIVPLLATNCHRIPVERSGKSRSSQKLFNVDFESIIEIWNTICRIESRISERTS